MATAPAVNARPTVSPTVRGPSMLGVGMVVWLSSELMFFAGLFAAYFTLRASNAHVAARRRRAGDRLARRWPPRCWSASSCTMHLAVRRSERGDRAGAVALAAGHRWRSVCVFLGNQALEYAELPFSISSHAYGSIFYLMTGFHGLHVHRRASCSWATVVGVIGGPTSAGAVGSDRRWCARTTGTSSTSCGSPCSRRIYLLR